MSQRLFRLGITGGIGSGKTYVCHRLEARGIPIYYADARGRQLQDTDPQLRAQITALLGAEAYTAEGLLYRPWVAQRVFGNPDLLQSLNRLVHPAVHADAAAWFAQQAAQGIRVAGYEAAILFEFGRQSDFDAVMLVMAPEDVRIQRVMARDGISEADVRARMARQWPDDKKLPLATYVVINDGVLDVDAQLEVVLRTIQATSLPG